MTWSLEMKWTVVRALRLGVLYPRGYCFCISKVFQSFVFYCRGTMISFTTLKRNNPARLTHPQNHPFSQNLASTFLSVSCNAHSLLALRLLTLSACARVNPFASTAALYPTHVLPSTSSSLTTSFVFPSARLYTVTTAAPPNPRLCCKATFAPGTRRLLAQPRSCQTSSAHCASPVAPSGWPLDMRPPEGFTTQRPP